MLLGPARRYKLLDLESGQKSLEIRGFGATKRIEKAERLRFEDRLVKVRSLKRRDVGRRL